MGRRPVGPVREGSKLTAKDAEQRDVKRGTAVPRRAAAAHDRVAAAPGEHRARSGMNANDRRQWWPWWSKKGNVVKLSGSAEHRGKLVGFWWGWGGGLA